MGMPEDIRALQQEIRWLKREIAARAVKKKGGGGATTLRTIRIDRGNTLTTGQLGCKYSSSAITDVPSAYDPNVTSSFIDGVCRGTLHLNGVAQSGFVLCHNDSTGALSEALVTTDVVVVGAAISMTVAGDPATTVLSYPALFF